jgi:hypothetical protein
MDSERFSPRAAAFQNKLVNCADRACRVASARSAKRRPRVSHLVATPTVQQHGNIADLVLRHKLAHIVAQRILLALGPGAQSQVGIWVAIPAFAGIVARPAACFVGECRHGNAHRCTSSNSTLAGRIRRCVAHHVHQRLFPALLGVTHFLGDTCVHVVVCGGPIDTVRLHTIPNHLDVLASDRWMVMMVSAHAHTISNCTAAARTASPGSSAVHTSSDRPARQLRCCSAATGPSTTAACRAHVNITRHS